MKFIHIEGYIHIATEDNPKGKNFATTKKDAARFLREEKKRIEEQLRTLRTTTERDFE